jgi:two-component system sensor histidine kinase BaeS
MGDVLGLSRAGWRLMGALLLVSLASMAVLVVGVLATDARSRSLSDRAQLESLAADLTPVVLRAYQAAGGWDGVDLQAVTGVADAAGAHAVVVDETGEIVWGAPVGPNFASRAASSPLQVSGAQVGELRIGFRGGQQLKSSSGLSPWWFLLAAVAAIVCALVVSLLLARRFDAQVSDFIRSANEFASGDHSVRVPDLGPGDLGDMGRAMNRAAEEVQRSEDSRRRLAADIAHELRTPLTALQAGLEELRDGYVAADYQTLAALHDQATRLGRIVNDLTDLSALGSSGLHLEIAPVDLGEVARLTVAAGEGAMHSKALRVLLDVEPDVWVRADDDRLHQVVGNLLANTALYCRPGDRVTVRVRATGDEGVLEVVDTGPGFAEDELPHVFDRSWRGHSADGTSGSGLGLPIVRALVVAQGGEVLVESEEGRGACISIRLPLQTPAGVPQAEPGAHAQ